jgi:NAD(P)-dependent dehydrogenase (short-subunit alcohol dehydrogenase family)
MSSSQMSLKNRNAIVTGAARGIGRAIAERLAGAGARVAVADIDQSAADDAAKAIGRRALAVRADVSRSDEVERMVKSLLETWGAVDILINNAGVLGYATPVRDLSEEEWDRVITVNLKSVFLCSRAVVGHMMDQGKGAIISVASVAGKEGNPNMSPYAVSKAGIICFTKGLAREVLPYGIRVNCVAPALIETPLLDGYSEKQIEYLKSKIPMGRLGRAEEVAAVVHFLVSDDASFVTGQCYDISGGRSTY